MDHDVVTRSQTHCQYFSAIVNDYKLVKYRASRINVGSRAVRVDDVCPNLIRHRTGRSRPDARLMYNEVANPIERRDADRRQWSLARLAAPLEAEDADQARIRARGFLCVYLRMRCHDGSPTPSRERGDDQQAGKGSEGKHCDGVSIRGFFDTGVVDPQADLRFGNTTCGGD